MSLVAPALPQAEKRPVASAPARLRSAHKFGGSSLADAARFRNVNTLLAGAGTPGVVVVSAMSCAP